MTEHDPTGKDPHEHGAKLDHGKPPVLRGLIQQFPRACMAVSEVSAFGAKKYTWDGWRSVPDGIVRYGNAKERHACKEVIEGLFDADSRLLHAAHEAWNAMARLELILLSLADKPLQIDSDEKRCRPMQKPLEDDETP